jgi:Aspartyl protease
MKFPLLHACSWIVLAAGFPITSIASRADTHCPGNVAALHPRLVAGALLVIPVKINQSGPYDFMVDTGSQFNVIDPALAASLQVKAQGTIGVIATATYSQQSVAALDSLEAGSHLVSKPMVMIEDLGPIQAADPKIRGVLGENFLAHFDVLIDYGRGLLCLGQASVMENDLRGERIPLVTSGHPETEMPSSPRLVISVNLSDTGSRPILLQLDSGSDGPMLYAGNPKLERPILRRARLQSPEVGEARRAFAVLPPQHVRIGSRVIPDVPFVTPVHAAQNVPDREEDGLLATVLFQRVYISHGGHYVIFDPR